MKKIISLQTGLLFAIFSLLLFVCGCPEDYSERCEKRKNTTTQEVIDLRSTDFPYHEGDVVLLKPDRFHAVIVSVGNPKKGTYEVKWDETGKEYSVVRLIGVANFKCIVRYSILKEQPKTHIFSPDEPTVRLHYEEREINWYEIFEKVNESVEKTP